MSAAAPQAPQPSAVSATAGFRRTTSSVHRGGSDMGVPSAADVAFLQEQQQHGFWTVPAVVPRWGLIVACAAALLLLILIIYLATALASSRSAVERLEMHLAYLGGGGGVSSVAGGAVGGLGMNPFAAFYGYGAAPPAPAPASVVVHQNVTQTPLSSNASASPSASSSTTNTA